MSVLRQAGPQSCSQPTAVVMDTGVRRDDEAEASRYAPSSLRFLQPLQRGAHGRIEPFAAGVEMGKDRLAHPRVPEFPDVFGNARYRLVVALALEESTDLVGHVDQSI